MTSKQDYLKKYLSGDQDKKKKKKSKENKSRGGLRLVEEDAFLSVEAAKARDIGSDEEREEIEVLKQSVKKAKVIHGFKQTFAQVDAPKQIKQEPLSPGSSPPRKPRQRHDSDNSPPRPSRQRHDSDNSPPRRGRARHDSDNSPPRPSRRRHDSDNSPPRSGRKRRDSDNSPVRRRSSPPRGVRTRHDSDNSPPRRGSRTRHDSDNSPPRRRQNEKDSSPPRRRRNADEDMSPPRKSRKIEEPKRIKKEEPDSDTETTRKTLEGKKAGLQSAKDLREESDRLRAKHDKMFEDMDSELTGRFAETVHRQKQTKRKGKDTEEDQEKKEREAKKTEELKEKYKSWNRGVAQLEERKEQLEEMVRVAAEPLARARDDDAMNAHMKEVLHAADPMAAMIQKKRRDTAIDRGELVYPTYQGPWTPNRFGIAPGYRWDGVDRSNGFEGKLAKTANTRAANQSEYYKSIAEYE